MKILMVSIPSLHFFRWVSQLRDSGHEVYWFDVTGMNKSVERISWISQNADWKLKWDFPGRTLIKRKLPKLYKVIQLVNEKNILTEFEKYFLEVKPDIVHSFALYVACTPILGVMNRHPGIKWIYSSWGSDLFYFQNDKKYLDDIKAVLPRVNYLFTDCKRDYAIAKKYGFKGIFLGVFPGGGGFHLKEIEKYKLPVNQRKTILIKGYQGRSGRAIPVLQAVEQLKDRLEGYQIKVFGADSQTFDFIKDSVLVSWDNFIAIGKLSHSKVLELMGEALVYIGNSNSDGMPNTLLEAICMGAFPVQSNPGGATEEIIEHGVNGFLIGDCEDVKSLMSIIEGALEFNHSGINTHHLVLNLDFEIIKNKVNEIYNNIG